MLPIQIQSPADVAAVEAAAQRIDTVCAGANIRWHRWGSGAQTTLLLHGGAGSWTHWVRNIGALVDAGRCVLAPDLPGFGASERPVTGEDADAIAPLIEDGLQQLIGDAACDVVAFSFGGIVASFLAAAQPRRLRQLVLAGAPALSVEPVSRLGLRQWVHLPAGEERNRLHRYNLRQMMLARDESVDELVVWLHDTNIVRDRMPRRRLAHTDAIWQLLPRIGCPLSGIWGGADRLYEGRMGLIDDALQRAPDFRSLAMLPGAGHWVQFEDAAAFNETLAATLAAGAPIQSASNAAAAPKA
ncbi:alpha/beta fold hydrolase [Piscinibacter sakaiensis]|uniref:alpha/beta fold hydrolase n=1 Tax=Piscinibacter sakaiensis TaxID=1547922 RepID=UPI003AADB78F